MFGTVDGSEIRDHQLRLVVYTIIYRVLRGFIHPFGGGLGFLMNELVVSTW